MFLKQGDLRDQEANGHLCGRGSGQTGVGAAAGRMEQKTAEVLFTFDYMSI